MVSRRRRRAARDADPRRAQGRPADDPPVAVQEPRARDDLFFVHGIRLRHGQRHIPHVDRDRGVRRELEACGVRAVAAGRLFDAGLRPVRPLVESRRAARLDPVRFRDAAPGLWRRDLARRRLVGVLARDDAGRRRHRRAGRRRVALDRDRRGAAGSARRRSRAHQHMHRDRHAGRRGGDQRRGGPGPLGGGRIRASLIAASPGSWR